MAPEVVARITLTIILFEKLHTSGIIMVDSCSNYGRVKHHNFCTILLCICWSLWSVKMKLSWKWIQPTGNYSKYFCLPTQLLIFSQVSRKKKLRIKVVCDVIFFGQHQHKDASHLKEGGTNHFYSHNFDALGRNGIKYEKQYLSDHHACSPWIYFTLILI